MASSSPLLSLWTCLRPMPCMARVSRPCLGAWVDLCSLTPLPVIRGSPLTIAQYGIRIVEPLHRLRCIGRRVEIRMVLSRQPLVRGLDHLWLRRVVNLENFVPVVGQVAAPGAERTALATDRDSETVSMVKRTLAILRNTLPTPRAGYAYSGDRPDAINDGVVGHHPTADYCQQHSTANQVSGTLVADRGASFAEESRERGERSWQKADCLIFRQQPPLQAVCGQGAADDGDSGPS